MFWKLISWWQWYWRAKGKYKIHSPRAVRFIQLVLEDQRWYYAFDKIERERARLLADPQLLAIEDHGAGHNHGQRSVKSIAQSSLSPDWQCMLLFRLACAFPSSLTLELGTSLGISTAYLAKAVGQGKLLALEGAPSLAGYAAEMHRRLHIHNIEWQIGPFQKTLEPALIGLERPINLVYLDGHHKGDAVQAYVRQLLPYLAPDAIIVVDDVRWSKDMYSAWQALQQLEAFDTCLDLGWAGLLFKGTQPKIREALIPWRWKPWQLGFLAP